MTSLKQRREYPIPNPRTGEPLPDGRIAIRKTMFTNKNGMDGNLQEQRCVVKDESAFAHRVCSLDHGKGSNLRTDCEKENALRPPAPNSQRLHEFLKGEGAGVSPTFTLA